MKFSKMAILALATTLLANEEVNLDTIVVTPTKYEQSLKEVTSNIEVLTSQDIEEKRFKSINEALNTVSGISFTSNGGLGKTSSIFLRGMDPKHTLVLIDGVRYQDPSNTSGASISHLLITDIEKIEVLKGAQSGIWGADAAAGVINIITKNPDKKGFSGSIKAEYGSYNTKILNTNLSYDSEKYFFKLNGNLIRTDGFSAQAPRGEDVDKYEDDGYENDTLCARIGFKIDENSLLLIDHKDIDGISDYDSWNNPDDTTQKSDFNSKLTLVEYKKKIKNHSLDIRYERSKFTRDEKGTTYGVKVFDGELTKYEVTDAIKYNLQDTILVGISTQKDEVSYTQVDNTSNSDDYTSKALFATNTNTISDGSTILTESIRYDKFSDFDNKTTGKIGLKHFHSHIKGLTTSINIASAYTTPSILQMLNPWGVPNPDLQPEKTKSYDVTASYKDFSATYFYQKIDDLIQWTGSWPNAGYTNIDGTSKIKGYELNYKKAFGDTLLSLSYTKLSAKDENDQDLPRRAKENLKFSTDYYGIDKLTLSLYGEYVGERYDDVAKTKQTGRYTVANFAANYQIKKELSAYIKVDNITDKYYQTVDGYATSSRAYYVGFEASF